MRMILIATTGGVGTLLCIVAIYATRVGRVGHTVVPVEIERPSPAIRVLRTEEELGEALRRAARSEQLTADAYRHRVARDESMLQPLQPARALQTPRALEPRRPVLDDDTGHPLSA